MASGLSTDHILRRRLGLRIRRFRGTLFVGVDGVNHEFTESAVLILERMDGASTLGSIARDLAVHYEVGVEDVVDDVLQFAGQLERDGIAERAGTPSTS